jgi:hypothetical protein
MFQAARKRIMMGCIASALETGANYINIIAFSLLDRNSQPGGG